MSYFVGANWQLGPTNLLLMGFFVSCRGGSISLSGSSLCVVCRLLGRPSLALAGLCAVGAQRIVLRGDI